MIRLKKKDMDEKLKLVMEFVKVPEEKQETIEYAIREKTEEES